MQHEACTLTRTESDSDPKSLFEECAWLYALCREYLFRDHTEQIVQSLFPSGLPSQPTRVLEVGCGPGFYSRRLARRFIGLDVLGVDRSSRLISSARRRATADRLANCHFLQGDVKRLCEYVEPVDAVISSRLLLVVSEQKCVMAEIFQVLKPGGRLFLAEPTAKFKTHLPISAMRMASRLMPSSRRPTGPLTAKILGSRDFEDLVRSQPWDSCSFEMYGDYQCAICRKDPGGLENAEGEALLANASIVGNRGISL